jgi:hypothetical protein
MDADNDLKYFGEQIFNLCAMHRVNYNTGLMQGYWNGLKDLSREDFDRALQYLYQESKFMPKPREFRDALRRGWH